MELAKLLDVSELAELARTTLHQPSFLHMSSDRRFDTLIEALRKRAGGSEPIVFRNAQGVTVVRAEQNGKVVRVSVDERAAPGLGTFLIEALPDILARFDQSGGNSQG